MTITKKILKKKIDMLPDAMVEDAYKLIKSLEKGSKKNNKKITFKLGGQFDKINVREYAYRKSTD